MSASPYLRRKEAEFRDLNSRVIEEFQNEGYIVVSASDLVRVLRNGGDVFARSRVEAALGAAHTAQEQRR